MLYFSLEMCVTTARIHLLSRLAFAVALGGSLVACSGDDHGSAGQGPGSSCEAALEAHEIPTISLEIGLSGAPIEVAGDRVRVTLATGDEAEIAALAARLDQAGLCLCGIDLERGRALVRLTPGMPLEAALGHLDTVPGIASAAVDPIVRGTGKGASATSGPSMWHLAALRLGPAQELQAGASGVTVALLDTGLTTDESGAAEAPGLESTPVLPGLDLINLDGDPADDNGHGTLLAGILASEGEYPGVAPDVTLLPVKVLDHHRLGTESALADGIHYAVAQGADVISMSLAFPPGYIPSFELAEAVHEASRAGVVLVAAAGNHRTGEIGYPAAFGEVIAVGGGRLAKQTAALDTEAALDVDGRKVATKLRKAEYSGWGAGVDLLGPGGSMDHDLDRDGYPDAIAAIGPSPSGYAGFLIAGTSPAAVEVTGVASLLLAGGADPRSIRPLMMANSTPLPPVGFDIFAGTGVVDAYQSLKQLRHDNVQLAPRLFANPILALTDDVDGNRRAIALVEVIDLANQPVAGATVLGHFRGPVTHSAAATTDELGRAIMVSNPGLPGADLFEFGVDKIIQSLGDGSCDGQLVSIPGSFARFEEMSFRFFAAFDPGGTGVDPVPFMLFIPPDALSSVVADFSLTGKTGAPTASEPVATIPADLGSYALVESLLVRSFGTAGSVAPVVYAIDRTVLDSDCSLAEGGALIPTDGVGVDPVPFRIGEDLLGLPSTFDRVTLRSDGGLFLNGELTSESELGLLTGTRGTVMIQSDGSVCLPQSNQVSDVGVFATGVTHSGGVTIDGISFAGSTAPSQSPPAPLSLGDTTLGTAIGQGLVSSASSGAATQASAAIDDVQP